MAARASGSRMFWPPADASFRLVGAGTICPIRRSSTIPPANNFHFPCASFSGWWARMISCSCRLLKGSDFSGQKKGLDFSRPLKSRQTGRGEKLVRLFSPAQFLAEEHAVALVRQQRKLVHRSRGWI